jgi:hypothetical protein
MVAEDLHIDQVEIRKTNAVTSQWRTANGMMVDVSAFQSASRSPPKRLNGRRVGKEDPKEGGSGLAVPPIPLAQDWVVISAPL